MLGHGPQGTVLSPTRIGEGRDVSKEIAMMSATQLVGLFRRKKLSPVEATKAALGRIADLNGTLNAFNLVDEKTALAAAKRSEKRYRAGRPLGPVDGVPTGIKDILLTKGWPTRRGSKTVKVDQPWLEDAPSVARLREGGAVFLGKTTTPEFGWKGVTDSALTGITRNPWNPALTPGGSSGGAAAAVATGMGALHLGTDGGGSIRIPCGFTGIFGIKQSFGRVPAYPASPFATVAHVGPMTRTVEDAALLLSVVTQPDNRDFYAAPADGADYRKGLKSGIKGLRVAFAPTLGDHPVEPEIAALVANAAKRFKSLGAKVEDAAPDLGDYGAVFQTFWFAAAANLLSTFTPEQKRLIDPGLVAVAAEGAKITMAEYFAATKAREALGLAMSRFHERYDLLLLPTLPLPAFEVGRVAPVTQTGEGWVDWTPFTYCFNLSKQPAATVPCGLTRSGLPAGLQIVGRMYEDMTVLRAAYAFEAANPWKMPEI
jgi:aspartyl-tRNA(Asn)/glutamyl-tRNA(Gln) amidotransferase subunit A